MNKTRRNIYISAAVLGLAIIVTAVLVRVLLLDRTVSAPPAKIAISDRDRVLIIAPHPDDETLGPGLVAKQAVQNGAAVKAVIVTEGDAGTHAAEAEFRKTQLAPADYLKLGEIRHKESLAAMRGLGIKDVVFLGFADGSTNSLWRANWDDSVPHEGRNGKTAVPYSFAYDKGAVYSGNSLAETLGAVISEFKPTIIFYPTPEDMHHDHWAVNAFTQYVLAKKDIKSREYTYLVHRGGLWPSPPLYRPNDSLKPPAGLGEIDAAWIKYEVAGEVRADKLEAVNKYKSQTSVNGIWLRSFVRKNELFATYPTEKTTRSDAAPRFLEGKALPGAVKVDYEASELSKKMGGKGDIRQFSFVFDKDFAYVAVKLDEQLPADVAMMINMRFFTAGEVTRTDIRVLNGEVSPIDMSRELAYSAGRAHQELAYAGCAVSGLNHGWSENDDVQR